MSEMDGANHMILECRLPARMIIDLPFCVKITFFPVLRSSFFIRQRHLWFDTALVFLKVVCVIVRLRRSSARLRLFCWSCADEGCDDLGAPS